MARINLGAVQDAPLGDERVVDLAALELGGRQEPRVGVDRVILVVEIKRRDRLAERQVGLEVRLDRPHVLPVAPVDVGLHALAGDRVGDDVSGRSRPDVGWPVTAPARPA